MYWERVDRNIIALQLTNAFQGRMCVGFVLPFCMTGTLVKKFFTLNLALKISWGVLEELVGAAIGKGASQGIEMEVPVESQNNRSYISVLFLKAGFDREFCKGLKLKYIDR